MIGCRTLSLGSAGRYRSAHLTLRVSIATKRRRWSSCLPISLSAPLSLFYLPIVRLSAASRMSVAVFDAGIRSTGHFEIATKVETLTFREICLLFLSMFISSLPALVFGICFSLFQAWYVNTVAEAVLEELSEQPSGWASAPDFNYLDHGKLSQESRSERVRTTDHCAL